MEQAREIIKENISTLEGIAKGPISIGGELISRCEGHGLEPFYTDATLWDDKTSSEINAPSGDGVIIPEK